MAPQYAASNVAAARLAAEQLFVILADRLK
jgi:hypothetical protein